MRFFEVVRKEALAYAEQKGTIGLTTETTTVAAAEAFTIEMPPPPAVSTRRRKPPRDPSRWKASGRAGSPPAFAWEAVPTKTFKIPFEREEVRYFKGENLKIIEAELAQQGYRIDRVSVLAKCFVSIEGDKEKGMAGAAKALNEAIGCLPSRHTAKPKRPPITGDWIALSTPQSNLTAQKFLAEASRSVPLRKSVVFFVFKETPPNTTEPLITLQFTPQAYAYPPENDAITVFLEKVGAEETTRLDRGRPEADAGAGPRSRPNSGRVPASSTQRFMSPPTGAIDEGEIEAGELETQTTIMPPPAAPQ